MNKRAKCSQKSVSYMDLETDYSFKTGLKLSFLCHGYDVVQALQRNNHFSFSSLLKSL